MSEDKQPEELHVASQAIPMATGDGDTALTSVSNGAVSGEEHASDVGAGSDGDTIMVRQPETKSRGRGGSTKGRGKPRPSTKARKRKRDGDDVDSESEESEVYAPTNVMTKSGRSVQRPTSFVPPPATASPAATPAVKKKRIWRRNSENALCKLCQRGVSPASNMIVFCDGCNTPYHRWCHHPPIDQSVIEETDKEWYCRQCRHERIVPVAESDVAHFVAAPGAPYHERQRFFTNLTPGALVTLLTRMTTLHPDLPVFDGEFARKHVSQPLENGVHEQKGVQNGAHEANQIGAHESGTIYAVHDDDDDGDDGYGPDEHPAHYVRPGRGLMSLLPPDKADEDILVDEDNSKGVFHHIYIVDEKVANNAVGKK